MQVGLLQCFTAWVDRYKVNSNEKKAVLRDAQIEMAAAGATRMVAIALQDPDKEVLCAPCGAGWPPKAPGGRDRDVAAGDVERESGRWGEREEAEGGREGGEG